jgi:putative addiction module killer protein
MSDARPKIPKFYVDRQGVAHAEAWLMELKDLAARATLVARLARLRRGLLGDCERYGLLTELRVRFGPGYRVYVIEDGQ